MDDKVSVLHVQDRVYQDTEPVAAIYRNMGRQAAEQVVMRARGDVALTMAGLVGRVQASDLSDVARQLRRLQRVSEQLGLITVADVAGAARDCLERQDATAFSAVWARLVRVAEHSLAPDRDLRDQSV